MDDLVTRHGPRRVCLAVFYVLAAPAEKKFELKRYFTVCWSHQSLSRSVGRSLVLEIEQRNQFHLNTRHAAQRGD